MSSRDEQEMSLDTLYQEYVRLSTICHDYINSALSDLKMLGAMAAMVGWDPVSQLLELDSRLDAPVTAIGFIVLLLATGMLLFYDLFKQSIFFFHMDRMRKLESVLNRSSGRFATQDPLFHLACGWPVWFHRTHKPIATAFFLLFYLIIVGLPCGVLYFQGYTFWLIAYLVLSVAILVAHGMIASKVLHSLDNCGQ